MTDTTKTVLDQLASDKGRALDGIALGSVLLADRLLAYVDHVATYGGAGCTARVDMLCDLQRILGGIIASESQLSLVYAYEKRDNAGEYDSSEEQDAADAVVAQAVHISDLRQVRGLGSRTMEDALDALDEAVNDLDDLDEHEEETYPGIIDLPPVAIDPDLIRFLNSL